MLSIHLLYLLYFYLFEWRRKWQPTPVFLPGESHGWRSPVGSSPRGHKELDTTERLHFHFQLCGASILCFHILSSLRAHQLTISGGCNHWWLWHPLFMIWQEIFHFSKVSRNNLKKSLRCKNQIFNMLYLIFIKFKRVQVITLARLSLSFLIIFLVKYFHVYISKQSFSEKQFFPFKWVTVIFIFKSHFNFMTRETQSLEKSAESNRDDIWMS